MSTRSVKMLIASCLVPRDSVTLDRDRKTQYTIVKLLKNDSQNLATHYDFQFVLQALKDYKTYIQSGIFTGLIVSVYAIALFTPTIINEFGFYSDIHKMRGPYVIAGAFVSVVHCPIHPN
ncbi:hypothetical protein OG21DRAFT_1505114 [Imleria badia]|nr:hypothetical protein OG21DRAFT_1505114 [Imleria badia]